MTSKWEEARRISYAFYHGATKQLMKMFINDVITKNNFIRAMNEQIERLEKELEKSYANIS